MMNSYLTYDVRLRAQVQLSDQATAARAGSGQPRAIPPRLSRNRTYAPARRRRVSRRDCIRLLETVVHV